MNMSFHNLCSKLNLPDNFENEANLTTLETWCHEQISRDIFFSGTAAERYKKFRGFVENYLDNFLAHLPSKLEQKMPCYGKVNAIHYAAQQGYDRFFDLHPDISTSLINEADAHQMTPLHKAATQGHIHTVRALLAKKADVHALNAQNQLPVHRALFVPIIHHEELLQRKEDIVRELLPLTPEAFTAQDENGDSLVHLAATHGLNDPIEQAIKHNQQLLFVSNNAAHYPIHTAILNGHVKTAELLLNYPKVAQLGDGSNRLPLHYAARYGSEEMTRLCIKASSDINSRDKEGMTPLLWAARDNNLCALKLLIDQKADPLLSDYRGFNILHYAVETQNSEMVHWIVEHVDDAVLYQADKEHKTALSYAMAMHEPNQDIIDFLKDNRTQGRQSPPR